MLSRKKKVYFRVNIVSLLFAVVSLISVTLAWFAYSGLASARTEVDVKAWYIEFEKDNQVVSNDIVISLDDIYPGMEPRTEKINIKNLGDADTKLKYKIGSARILDSQEDNYVVGANLDSNTVEDALSHNYPFHINIALDKLYLDAKQNAVFEVSITWPLDSGNDTLDSLWGTKAYQYEHSQDNLEENEKSSAIEVVINVTAEQAIDDLDSVDINYLLGNEIKYDIENGKTCETLSSTCIKTHVIDNFNKVEDEYVNLLPEKDLGTGTFQEYQNINPNWNTEYRLLSSEDIINVISVDIENSFIKINGISDSVVGRVLTTNRANIIINNVVNNNGYFEHKSFSYINSNTCIWTNTTYNDKGFALDKTRLYGENKNTACRMIPVLRVQKNKLVVS